MAETVTLEYRRLVDETLRVCGQRSPARPLADGLMTLAPATGAHCAGPTHAARRLTLAGQTLDPLDAGVASFPLTRPSLPTDRLVLLVAVVRAGGDVALAEMPLREGMLTHPGVAVRAVRIG